MAAVISCVVGEFIGVIIGIVIMALNSARRADVIRENKTTPCDLCIYNPPSSFDGKPCSACPAAGEYKEE